MCLPFCREGKSQPSFRSAQRTIRMFITRSLMGMSLRSVLVLLFGLNITRPIQIDVLNPHPVKFTNVSQREHSAHPQFASSPKFTFQNSTYHLVHGYKIKGQSYKKEDVMRRAAMSGYLSTLQKFITTNQVDCF